MDRLRFLKVKWLGGFAAETVMFINEASMIKNI